MKSKRVHSAAKNFGITQIGCYETTLATIRKGIEAANVRTKPRNLLRMLDGTTELFCDMARAKANNKGSRLEICFTEMETNGATTVRYNGKPVLPHVIEDQVKKSRKNRASKAKNSDSAARNQS